MTAISTIKKLAATTALAGSLGIAALSLGSAVAAADSGAGSTSSSSTSPAADPSTTSDESTPTGTVGAKRQTIDALPPSLKERISGLNSQKGEEDDVTKLQESLAAAKDSDQTASDFLRPINEKLKELSDKTRR